MGDSNNPNIFVFNARSSLEGLLIPTRLLLRMMNRADVIGTHLVKSANIAALGDDGLRGELAYLKLGTLGLSLALRFLTSDVGVLVSRQNLAAFLLLTV